MTEQKGMISIGELLQQDKETIYEVTLLCSTQKPIDTIFDTKCRPIYKMRYENVIEIKDLWKSNAFMEIVLYLLKENGKSIEESELLTLRADHYYFFISFIREELIRISNMENELYAPPSSDLMLAGIDRLNVFEDANVIDSLASGDLLKWEKITKLPYEMVYTKLMMNKVHNEIKESYSDIMRAKSKSRR